VFVSPAEVVHDPSLSIEDKREILRRWVWDAWLLEVAADEAMAEGEPSRLDEVKAALGALDQAERTTVLVMTGADDGSSSSPGWRRDALVSWQEFSAADEAATGFAAGSSPHMGRSGRETPATGEWSNLACR